MRRMRTLVVAVTAVAVFALLAWSGPAQGATTGGQRTGESGDAVGARLHDSAKEFGESLLGGVKFVGRTVVSPFTGTTGKVGRDADATGKRLHHGAKGFGEGLYGGLKYTGRTIAGFFSDSHEKGNR
jgi:hypothetical protein